MASAQDKAMNGRKTGCCKTATEATILKNKPMKEIHAKQASKNQLYLNCSLIA
jgi:hypothetical protein